jgi:hypothetical protein
MEMNATTTEARLTGFGAANEKAPTSDATRLAQYNMLNEMPGAIFGIITIAYIFSSLLSLAR